MRGPADRPILLILDPDVRVDTSRRITDEINITPARIESMLGQMDLSSWSIPSESSSKEDSAFGAVAGIFFNFGLKGIVEALRIAQIEVVVARRPNMEPLRVPAPCLRLDRGNQVSTAGIYCRDADGTVGLTACLHGTGPIGTPVTLGGRHQGQVALADPVQDLVFVPLPAGCPAPAPGQSLVLAHGAPGQGETVDFEGVTTGRAQTRIMGHDTGLLRRRPTVQLRVQTDPDSNPGDSGSALLRQGELLGFAFEVTAPGDYPQFSDWVWAPNALAALGLTPA